MSNKRIEWQSLLPSITPYQDVFDAASQLAPTSFETIQPKLASALALFCHPNSLMQFMLLKAKETREYLSLIARIVQQFPSKNTECKGSNYVIQRGGKISVEEANCHDGPFAARGKCLFQEWVESEQLFGCVRIYNAEISLQPGLLHNANGGVLILAARSLITQPLLWLRLKQMITQRQFYWISPDEMHPLPITVPPMPLELRLIIVGDRQELASFYEIEPDFTEQAIYGEYEDYLKLNELKDMSQWCGYVKSVILERQLPPMAADAWPPLVRNAVRYSGDQSILPLSLQWIGLQLAEASLYTKENIITEKSFIDSMSAREWRESYLEESMRHEIELGQIMIETEGEVVGQINGLSILDYLGYPRSLGEPSRISCVVHFGDGELTDVERKSDLGGNLHAKGMMIMQAFLISELDLNHQLPFSASIVFEQSHSEVDGDSASLAELCALISALSQQPIRQQIAVTGAVDQFGKVQQIGGINEKVEGFFQVCLRRGLSGKQGVILPATNVRHLCLRKDVVNAVREGQFHLWGVSNVAEALPLLTGSVYSDAQYQNLLSAIHKRIIKVNSQERRCWPWPLCWLT